MPSFELRLSASKGPELNQQYTPPNNSVWIVAVDCNGMVHILTKPNIDPNFFEVGTSYFTEEVGLPADVDFDPGVYEWTCNFQVERNYESGVVEGDRKSVV